MSREEDLNCLAENVSAWPETVSEACDRLSGAFYLRGDLIFNDENHEYYSQKEWLQKRKELGIDKESNMDKILKFNESAFYDAVNSIDTAANVDKALSGSEWNGLQFPLVGDHLEISVRGGSNVGHVFERVVMGYVGSKYCVFKNEGGKEYSRKKAGLVCRPIPAKTPREKALEDALGDMIDCTLTGNFDELSRDEKNFKLIIEAIEQGKITGISAEWGE
jgi:hypothetical protein